MSGMTGNVLAAFEQIERAQLEMLAITLYRERHGPMVAPSWGDLSPVVRDRFRLDAHTIMQGFDPDGWKAV